MRPNQIRRVAVVLMLFLWCAVGLCNAQGEPVLVRFQPKVGDQWTSTFVITQKNEIGATTPPVVTESKAGYTMDVVVRQAVSPDSFLLEYTFTRTRIQGTNPGMTYDFDSANPPATLTGETAGAYGLVGCRFTIVVDDLGKVTELRGVDDMQKNIASRVREKSGSNADAILKTMSQSTSARGLTEILITAFVPLPRTVIKSGSAWEQVTKVKQPTPMEIAGKYTAAEMKAESARITFANTVFSLGGKPVERAGAKVTINLKGTQQGTADVYLSSGVSESFVMDQKLAGTMEVDTGSGQNSIVNMVLNTNITMKTKPAGAAK